MLNRIKNNIPLAVRTHESAEREFNEPLCFYQFVPEADYGKPGIMVYKENDIRKAIFYIMYSGKSKKVRLTHDYPKVEVQYSILDILVKHMYDEYSVDEIYLMELVNNKYFIHGLYMNIEDSENISITKWD